MLSSLSNLRFVCSKEGNWKFLGRNLLFWCRKINLNRDKKTSNEIIVLRVSTQLQHQLNKPSLSSALISKYIELTRAGQCRNPRIFAQIKSPGEKDILRLFKSKGLEDFAKLALREISNAHWYNGNLAPDLSVLVSTVETTSFPAPFPREKALGTRVLLKVSGLDS